MKYHIEKNTVQETEVVNFARAVVTGAARGVQPAAEVHDRRVRVRAQIVPHLAGEVYFLTPQVKALVCAMAEAFPGGKLVFDAANRKAVKLMLKTWLKDAEIKDVGAYFAVTDARRELSAWSDRLRVSSRGYMLGYNDLRNQNVRKFFRFLSKSATA